MRNACSRSRLLARSRIKKTRDELSQPVRILSTHGRKLDAHSLAGFEVANCGMTSDFAFRDGKQNGNDGPNRCGFGCRNKQAANIQIADPRDGLFLPVLLPCDPNATRRCDPRKTPVVLPVFSHTQHVRWKRRGILARIFPLSFALYEGPRCKVPTPQIRLQSPPCQPGSRSGQHATACLLGSINTL